MNTNNKISRRDFIKTSVVTGGALIASTTIPGQAMNLLQKPKDDAKFVSDELLQGVCDIHLGEGTKMPQYQRQSIEDFASFVHIDPTRSFISTDLGQAVMPHPIEGMRDCIVKLQSAGVSQSDIDLLVRRNPAWLIGLDK